MRAVAILLIVGVLGSLGSALYYLVKDQGQSQRTVRALTARITISIVLFLFLMLAFYLGWIPRGHRL